MRGTLRGGFVPSCSYYDEDAGRWDSAGLAIEAMTTVSSSSSSSSSGAAAAAEEEEEEAAAAGGFGGHSVNGVTLTCLSFHLSDFTLSTEGVDAAFKTVPLVSCAGERCPSECKS